VIVYYRDPTTPTVYGQLRFCVKSGEGGLWRDNTFERRVIIVRDGKGAQDQATALPG
jgi:hypothetical protein